MSVLYSGVSLGKIIYGNTECNYVFARDTPETDYTQYNWKRVFSRSVQSEQSFSRVTDADIASLTQNGHIGWDAALQRYTIRMQISQYWPNTEYFHVVIGMQGVLCKNSPAAPCYIDVAFKPVWNSTDESIISVPGPMSTLPGKSSYYRLSMKVLLNASNWHTIYFDIDYPVVIGTPRPIFLNRRNYL